MLGFSDQIWEMGHEIERMEHNLNWELRMKLTHLGTTWNEFIARYCIRAITNTKTDIRINKITRSAEIISLKERHPGNANSLIQNLNLSYSLKSQWMIQILFLTPFQFPLATWEWERWIVLVENDICRKFATEKIDMQQTRMDSLDDESQWKLSAKLMWCPAPKLAKLDSSPPSINLI